MRGALQSIIECALEGGIAARAEATQVDKEKRRDQNFTGVLLRLTPRLRLLGRARFFQKKTSARFAQLYTRLR